MENHGFKKIVSYTTRPPRVGEQDGVDYHFVDGGVFSEMKEAMCFAETASYNGWFYGTDRFDCTDDKVAVLTPHGLRQLSKFTDIHIESFYVKVPRRDRLIKILQRGDNIEEAYRRSLSDVGQFDGIEDEVDHVLENPGYAKSVEQMTNDLLNARFRTI